MNTRLLTLPVVAALSLTTAYGTSAGATTAATAATGASGAPVAAGVVQAPKPSPASSPVGPGCSSLPQSGPGSVADLGRLRVVTAAAHSPDLSTFYSAVNKAGLVNKLNTTKDITVFAPTNEAFNKLGKRKLNKLLADKNALTKVLTYHVVQGRKTPADLKKGSFTTLEGDKITTRGSGDKIKVNDAHIVCGDLQTRNAALYLIDGVLTPKK
ncbi:fasciclin domain-containing protein [Sphaerisporangium sp. NPDC088356]|uniref:fasciclin domain-containing protein n=1 Tax=Sphaerisporangium sp. NPDC088356 TaxID=3154871 RepID=UPI00343C24E7